VEQDKNMRAKIIIAMFSGLLTCGLVVSAQNNPPAATENVATSTNAVMQSDTNTAVVVADASATSTNAPVQAASPVVEDTSTNSTTVAAHPAADANPVAPTTASAGMAAKAVIPLIVMDDVPLTDAIKNLARQASLNYMLDPKIAYGQPGPDGRPLAQPTVSIRWENVTAEQALNALLNNYGLQMIEDSKTKIARLTIKDPAVPDPLITKIVQLKYCSPSNILDSVRTALMDKRSKVTPDIRTSQLVVVATEREMDAVDELVTRLDTPTKQVLIEAKLLETSVNPSSVKGLNWSGTLQNQNLSLGNNLQQNSSSAALENTLSQTFPKVLIDTAKGFFPPTAFLDADGVSAVFSFLNTYSESKVISEPRTVTLDNETAHLEVTRATPIINVTAGTANTTGGSQITYTNLGIILDVTPRISANNYINLKIVPEVSRYADTVTKTIQGETFQADEYDLRRIETRVMIPSGNTLVLGGLVQDQVNLANTKVPVLGDIPGLGYLFRSDSKQRQKSNLLVFITPTIVQDSDYQQAKSDLLKTPVPTDKMADWSAWDSGKPYDWSNLADHKTNNAVYQPVP